jgi:replicative DNA helicase
MTAEVHALHGCRSVNLPPPISIEAEQGVLGAVLMQSGAIGPLSLILRPADFSEEIHRRIFDIAIELHRNDRAVTPATIRTYLGDYDLGGMSTGEYLARLSAEALPPLVVPQMAREVRDLASRRGLIAVGEQVANAAREARPGAGAAMLASEAIADLQRIVETAVDADTRRDAGQSATALVDRARAIMAGEHEDGGVSTGLPDIDLATGGFQPGTLWIVAGRPRMGKTILATGFARKIAARSLRERQGGKQMVGAQIFSLEVTEDQIVARILADLAYTSRHPITFGQIMLGALDRPGLEAIEAARDRLADMPLALDVAPSLSVAEIAARVRSEKGRMSRRGAKLGVIFIDYLKFVRATDRYRGNRVYEVGEITKELKTLAKAEGLCVVLLAQVNRAVDSRDRKDRSPGLADLRESGDLEADADVVLFIDRESVRIKQSPEYKAGDPEALRRFLELEHRADLIVAKTRVGSERTVSVWFHAGASTFSSHDRGGSV